MKQVTLSIVLAFIFSNFCLSQVKLPALIRDSMILQRDQPVSIWGFASPSEKITVQFNKFKAQTRANSAGQWKIELPATAAGGPYSIRIKGRNQIQLNHILFGDVYLCSGQSNMVHQLNIHDITYANEIATANYPQIRQFLVPFGTSLTGPESDLHAGRWVAAVGESVRPFSAVAYFFAKTLYDRYQVPIGIINASVGGSPIQAWISENGLKEFPAIYRQLDLNRDTARVFGLNREAAEKNARLPVPVDQGLTEKPNWFHTSYIPINWHSINVPGYWEDQGLGSLNGIVWYRREVDIPASMLLKPAKIFLGRLVDADELYINGQKVGQTGYQYPQRRYTIPDGLLHAGRNLIVVRVSNYQGKGGFVPDKPYTLFAGNDSIDLQGTWQYKVGATFDPNLKQNELISIQNQPAALYNSMIAPLINYSIRGICWYQGESDTFQPLLYSSLQKSLINDWRRLWNSAELPFLFVQLPGFMDYQYWPSESGWALFREAQAASLSIPHTAMATAIDLGEWNDIHPDNKKDVGIRLAKAAFSAVYGEELVYAGPRFIAARINGNNMTLEFAHTGGGLVTRDGLPPAGFAIAGSDRKFVWANAKIEGNKVVIWNNQIGQPKYVRYAWADNPFHLNLYNREGLPAEPFRTDR